MRTSKNISAVVRVSAVVMLIASFGCRAANVDAGTFKIERLSGAVKITFGTTTVVPHIGETLQLPAKIETAADGSLRIEQASSTLDVGPNSVILLPGASGSSEKILQNL